MTSIHSPWALDEGEFNSAEYSTWDRSPSCATKSSAMRAILESAAMQRPRGFDEQKIGDFYTSCIGHRRGRRGGQQAAGRDLAAVDASRIARV